MCWSVRWSVGWWSFFGSLATPYFLSTLKATATASHLLALFLLSFLSRLILSSPLMDLCRSRADVEKTFCLRLPDLISQTTFRFLISKLYTHEKYCISLAISKYTILPPIGNIAGKLITFNKNRQTTIEDPHNF